MKSSRDFLQTMGLPGGDPADSPASTKRFPDGGQYRIEIPSTEGPRALEQLLADEHVRARACITCIPDADGQPLPMHNVFPRLSRTPGSIRSLGPALGEHQHLVPPGAWSDHPAPTE